MVLLRPLSVRAQLALLALVCIVPLALILAFEMMSQARTAMRETAPAVLAAREAAHALDERIGQVNYFLITARVAVRHGLEGHHAGHRGGHLEETLASLREALPDGLYQLGYLDLASGRYTTTAAGGGVRPDPAWQREALAASGVMMGRPFAAAAAGAPRPVAFSVAIREPGGAARGLLVATAPVEALAHRMARDLARTAESWIDFGDAVAGADAASTQLGAALRHASASPDPVALPGRRGHHAAFANSRLTSWIVGVAVPAEARVGGALDEFYFKLLVAALAMTLSIAGAVAIHRELSRPVEALGHALAAVGKGEGQVRVDASGPLEVRALAAEFNRMSADIESMRARREAYVRVSSDWIWESDEQHLITDVSNAGDESFALRRHLLVGQPILGAIAPVEAEQFARLGLHLEKRSRFRDIRVLRQSPMGMLYLEISGEPMFGADGRFHGYVGTARNVTPLVLAQRALTAERVRFEAMIEAMHEGVVIIDREGRYVFANPAAERITGVPRERIVGASVYRPPWTHRYLDGTVMPDDDEDYLHLRVLASGGSVAFVSKMEQPDGTVACIEANGVPLRNAAGEIEHVLLTLDDVTEERDARERLAEANEELERRVRARTHELALRADELNELTYTVSHDLRAPLRAIDGYSSILAAERLVEHDGEGPVLLARIGENARHMGRMVDALLEYSSLARRPLARRAVNMNRVVQEALRDLPPQARERAAVEVSELGVHVADPATVRLLFKVLLDNALRFSGDAPSPRVRVEEVILAGARAWRVSDNGIGFDMAFAGQLFRIFQTLGREGGLGIGLATARRVVELHGGQISADSTPGEGAAFTFTLGQGEA